MAGSLLIRRLLKLEEPDIAVHLFVSITTETVRQSGTAEQAQAKILASGNQDVMAQYAGMTAEELTHWNWIIDQAVLANISRNLYTDVLICGEVAVYDEQDVIDRLGLPVT